MSKHVAAAVVELLRDGEVREALADIVRSVLAAQTPAARPDSHGYETRAEFAQRLGVSERTVGHWLQAGMPAVRRGSVVRVRVADAERWLLDGGSRNRAVLRVVRGGKASRFASGGH